MHTPHWRPQLHFSPRQHWINDPNGLVWHAGEYHLFYQYNPQGDTWGHMSWGHAVSTDLLHWEELPVAIPEDADWMIFSGSVVVDHAHTSGLGDGVEPPMVAIYTGHAQRPDAAGVHRQNQQLAWSTDRGRSWHKYPGNPVLDLGSGGFRDPKVFWHTPSSRWVMLVSMADEGYLRFFTSADLTRWVPTSDCRFDLPGCRVWECPDLMRLPVAGEPDAWLLKFDVFHGHPGGGSGALGVVGDFDGERFTARQAPQWLDGGMDFYAAIAFGAMPPGDERCVWLGWMLSHHYGKSTPTQPWRGAMTLPRELGLARIDGQLRVVQQPLRALQACRGAAWNSPAAALPGGRSAWTAALPAADNGQAVHAWDLDVEIDAQQATGWSLGLRVGGEEMTRVGVDRVRGELFIDRRHSGVDPGCGGFAGVRRLPWHGARAERVALRIVLDASSVEVFSSDGAAVLTETIYPREDSRGVVLESDAAVVLRRFTAWPLQAPARAPAP